MNGTTRGYAGAIKREDDIAFREHDHFEVLEPAQRLGYVFSGGSESLAYNVWGGVERTVSTELTSMLRRYPGTLYAKNVEEIGSNSMSRRTRLPRVWSS